MYRFRHCHSRLEVKRLQEFFKDRPVRPSPHCPFLKIHTVRANRKVRFQSEIVNRCGEPSCRASLTIKKMTKSHLDRKSQQKNDLLSGTMDRLLNRVSVRRVCTIPKFLQMFCICAAYIIIYSFSTAHRSLQSK